jgi:hypothetical protein
MKAGWFASLVAASLFCVSVPSCVTDNPAAYQGILGRTLKDPPATSGAGGGGNGAGQDGDAASGGEPLAVAGSAAAGKGGSATGDGGDSAVATGGTSGGGTGGTVMNPPTHPDFSPACFLTTTQSGEEILKGTSCTSADPKLCYRPCGPNQVGWKTETCTAGVYAEGDCTFPSDGDFSCYAIPPQIDEAACGLSASPAATGECNAPLCVSCNFGGFYEDTGHDAKEGYCTCREPGPDGVRRWTCASTTAWPCPFSQGC